MNLSSNDNKPSQIEALTSLRFFAAAAIVFLHSRPFFESTKNLCTGVPLHYGVTFFFILSGFILTYVYWNIKPGDWAQFYIFRIARIWPAHLISLTLLIILLPHDQWIWKGADAWPVTITNILLLHSLIPIPAYYFSYNGVSWSISTELIFYILFPFFALNLKRTWKFKFFVALACTSTMIFITHAFELPPYSPTIFLKPTSNGMVYINPLTRLLEFVLGMITAMFIRSYLTERVKSRKLSDIVAFTLIELLIILAACYMMAYLSRIPSLFGAQNETPLFIWICHSSGAFFLALLIAVFSTHIGMISSILKSRLLVILGDLSFSLYMTHQVILRYYINNQEKFAHLADSYRLYLYWFTCLTLAFIVSRIFEGPARKYFKAYATKLLGKQKQID